MVEMTQKPQKKILKRWDDKKPLILEKAEKTDEFVPTQEEALAKISMHLAKTEDEKILTDLDSRTINYLTILSSISEELSIDMYAKICKTYMRLRVSHKRLGRKELLEIARSVREEPIGKLNKLRNWLGLGIRV